MLSSQRGTTIFAALAFVGLVGMTSLVLSSFQNDEVALNRAALLGNTASARTNPLGPQKCEYGKVFHVNVENGKTTVTKCDRGVCNTPGIAGCEICPVYYCTKLSSKTGCAPISNSTCGDESFDEGYALATCRLGSDPRNTGNGNSGCISPDIKNALLSERILTKLPDGGPNIEDIPKLQQEYDQCSANLANGETGDCDEIGTRLTKAQKKKEGVDSLDAILKVSQEKPGNDQTPPPPPGPGYTGPRDISGLDKFGDGRGGLGGGAGRGGFGGGNNANTFGNAFGDSFNCSITASPSQINLQTQQGGQQTQQQPVTLRWQSSGGTQQNPPFQSVIYSVGTMGPNGSAVVYPRETTRYTMRVYGYYGGTADCETTVTVASQNPYGTGTDGRPCNQPPNQPDPAQCTSGTWRPVSATGNGCTTGYQCVPNTTSQPGAELTCEPKAVDEGMPVGIAWGCSNSTYATAVGFSVIDSNNAVRLSGTTQVTANVATTTYSISCGSSIATTTAQCSIAVAKPTIVFVSVPDTVTVGQSSVLGWVTSTDTMKKCSLSSPDFSDFTQQRKDNTPISGTVRTPTFSKTGSFDFVLKCDTNNGGSKTATTTVIVQ